HRYNELNFGRTVHEIDNADQDSRDGDRAADIADAWFEDESGARIAAIAHREPFTVGIEIRFHSLLENPIIGATIRNNAGATVFASTTDIAYGATGRFEAGDVAIVRLRVENWFTPASYTVTPSIARAGLGADTVDLRADLASIVIHGGHFTTGVVDLPHSFEIERRT
ncbi:MAG TPA: Wzt carbohydrate-binding domain-containing protein, partial [Solirubrobacteraceae bacterium]|nr:Wzt carbohydrate-binding domain-containing protein [Solirubrobacteraceae bacterium]